MVLVQVLTTGSSYAKNQPIDSSSVQKLRDRISINNQDFYVVLVGKDGGVKRRDTIPVQPKAIFDQIDAMPMRQQEMRDRR